MDRAPLYGEPRPGLRSLGAGALLIAVAGNVYATGDFGSSIDMGFGQVQSAGSQDTFFAKYSP